MPVAVSPVAACDDLGCARQVVHDVDPGTMATDALAVDLDFLAAVEARMTPIRIAIPKWAMSWGLFIVM